jgi:hypothetical protein
LRGERPKGKGPDARVARHESAAEGRQRRDERPRVVAYEERGSAEEESAAAPTEPSERSAPAAAAKASEPTATAPVPIPTARSTGALDGALRPAEPDLRRRRTTMIPSDAPISAQAHAASSVAPIMR